jgi:pimeloyl-ACP methyl ester carboxylesterase
MPVTNSWEHHFIETNRIKLHYVSQGQGKLMLMLHGFPEFWYSWRHQIPEFADDYQVVAIDLRGYNDSDKPQELEAYKISELVADVQDVISGLGYEDCILVGHDWGGVIAWYFTYAYPEMVEKLIVLNIPHPVLFVEGLKTPQQLLKSWYVFAFQLPWLPEFVFQLNDYQALALCFTTMAIDRTAFSESDLNAYKNAAAKRGALTAMINYYRCAFQSLLEGASQPWNILDVPTLTIWGENDVALGKELTYGTQKYVRNWQVKYIPNCSHWVQQEQPALVNRYIREFINPSAIKIAA